MTGSEVCAVASPLVAGRWPGRRCQFVECLWQETSLRVRPSARSIYAAVIVARAARRQNETRVERSWLRLRLRLRLLAPLLERCGCSASTTAPRPPVPPSIAPPRSARRLPSMADLIDDNVIPARGPLLLPPLPGRTWPSCSSWNASDNTNRISVTRNCLSCTIPSCAA